ncbi:MAG: class I SAM-dependent methyltransferase [Candidatus Omnitrophica bacterium]|nr:class I SAM-dependent methyltransferase [Candidatus Omnitrophota bacterium]
MNDMRGMICLDCGGALQPGGKDSGVICASCGKNYQVREGIPFIPGKKDLSGYDTGIAGENARIYDSLADLGTQVKGVNLLLSEYYTDRIRDIHIELLSPSLSPSAKVLEAGCGLGKISRALTGITAGYHGFDISYASVKKARDICMPGNSRFFVGNVLAIPFPEGYFDAVVSSEMLEHVPADKAAIAEMKRVLKPKGLLSVSVPNSMMAFYPLEFFSMVRHYGLKKFRNLIRRELDWAADEAYDRPYMPGQFRKLFTEEGLSIAAHRTALCYLWRRPYSDVIEWLEKKKWFDPAGFVERYFRVDSFMTGNRLPVLGMMGTRQFILARKDRS